MKTILAFLLNTALLLNVAAAETLFTYRPAESAQDPRFEYDYAVLDLALQKTIPAYGPYRLEPSQPMNTARAVLTASADQLPNLIIKLSYEPKYRDSELDFIPFPVDLGIVGYRICFLSQAIQDRVNAVNSLEQLSRLFSRIESIRGVRSVTRLLQPSAPAAQAS